MATCGNVFAPIFVLSGKRIKIDGLKCLEALAIAFGRVETRRQGRAIDGTIDGRRECRKSAVLIRRCGRRWNGRNLVTDDVVSY